MMRPYEAMFIVRPQLEDEQVDATVKKVEESITRLGGELARSEKKGKKRLAYEVKDQRDGHYVLLNFNLDSTKLPEIERQFRLNEDVIRHLVLRQEEVGPVLPKPSAAPPVVAATPVEA